MKPVKKWFSGDHFPSGNKRYLNTLSRIVKWVVSTPEMTQDTHVDWIRSQFGAKEAAAASYAHVVFTLSALEVKLGQDHETITSLGRSVLEAEGQAKVWFDMCLPGGSYVCRVIIKVG